MPLEDLHNKILDANFLHFHSVFEKFCLNTRLAERDKALIKNVNRLHMNNQQSI